MKVSIVQTQLHWENRERNLARIERHLMEAHPQTDLIVLPEMFSTGFSMNAVELAEEPEGPSYQWMQHLAQTFGAVVMGSLIIKDQGHYYNQLLAVFPDTGPCFRYNKRHLFRLAKEHEHYSPGSTKVSFTYKSFVILPLICYDLRFPVWSRNMLLDPPDHERLAYDVLVYVANWPERRGSQWTRLLQARAIENQCYVIGVNRVGIDGNEIVYRGDSGVYDPWGDPLVEIRRGESVETVELDHEKLTNYRRHFPAWQDADSFQLN
jgi:predicted amidohydrolase